MSSADVYPEKTHLHTKVADSPGFRLNRWHVPTSKSTSRPFQLSHVASMGPIPLDHADMLYALHPPGRAKGLSKRLLVGGERASHYIPPVIVGYQGCLFLKSRFSRSHVVSFPGFGLREELSHMGKPKILLSPKNTAMRHPRTQFETASALAPTQHDAPTVQPQHCARVAMQRQQDVGSVYGISSAR